MSGERILWKEGLDYTPAAGAGSYTFPRWSQYLLLNYNYCCGVKELSGLSSICYGNPANVTVKIAGAFGALSKMFAAGQLKCAFLMFTGVNDTTYCQEFTAHITANKLGDVITLPPTKNQNSLNMLHVHMWRVDHDAMKRYYHDKVKPTDPVLNAPVPKDGPTVPSF